MPWRCDTVTDWRLSKTSSSSLALILLSIDRLSTARLDLLSAPALLDSGLRPNPPLYTSTSLGATSLWTFHTLELLSTNDSFRGLQLDVHLTGLFCFALSCFRIYPEAQTQIWVHVHEFHWHLLCFRQATCCFSKSLRNFSYCIPTLLYLI